MNSFDLNKPAPVAARLLAALRLKDVLACSAFLGKGVNDVHDLRVSVRRLRSILRAFKHPLGKSITKIEKAFRNLARETDHTRDTEVQRDWFIQRRNTISKSERASLELLIQTLDARYQQAYKTLLRRWPSRCQDASRTLRKYLTGNIPRKNSETFAIVLAKQVAKHASRLQRSIVDFDHHGDTTTLHTMRIRGKQLRYLLEPFAQHIKGAKHADKELRGIQALLGDFHDLEVLHEKIRELRPSFKTKTSFRFFDGLLAREKKQQLTLIKKMLHRKRFANTLVNLGILESA